MTSPQPTGPDLPHLLREFVRDAFSALTAVRVLPTSDYYTYLQVGRDYFGDTIHQLPSYQVVEVALKARSPERFEGPFDIERPFENPGTFLFSFLEACIVRARGDAASVSYLGAVDESIEELLAVLGTASFDSVCARHVSHMTTTGGAELSLAGVTIVPDSGGRDLLLRVHQEIPGSPAAWNREDPRPYDPPHTLIVARQTFDGAEPYEAAGRVSRHIDRFLLLVRLLTGGTTQSTYEFRGAATLVAARSASFHQMNRSMARFVGRPVGVGPELEAGLLALGVTLDSVANNDAKDVMTSFTIAVAKFNRAHRDADPYELIVDLATGLEAALIGDDSDAITMRLRTRTAALLATKADSAKVIYDDVATLYELRSTLVHGGRLTDKKLRRGVAKISTVPGGEAEEHFGIAIWHAVDRLRDLLRRAILARLLLGADPSPLWPLAASQQVDSELVDSDRARAWRDHWHQRLTDMGAESAGDPVALASDILSRRGRSARKV